MPTSFTERRDSARHAVREAAKIEWPQNDAGLDCIATDISDGGARLAIRAAELPDVFVLHFLASGKRRHCRVVWRQGSETGVAFTDRSRVTFGRRVARP